MCIGRKDMCIFGVSWRRKEPAKIGCKEKGGNCIVKVYASMWRFNG